MKAVIDRFEGGYAVLLCGDGEVELHVPRAFLPRRAREGDWLRISFEPDAEETQKRRERAKNLLGRLKGK